MLAACSGDSPAAPTPVPTADEARIRRNAAQGQFNAMSPQIADLLKDEPWVSDGSEETVRALQAIVGAQATRPDDPGRAEEAMTMVQAMQRSSWYQDGVDTSEKVVIAEAFKRAVTTQARYTVGGSGEPRNTFLQNYDWPALLSLTLELGLFLSHTSAGGREIALLGTATTGFEEKASEALRIASEHMSRIEALSGEIRFGSVLILVEAEAYSNDRHVCGFAHEELFATHISHDCVTSRTVIHELAHLSTPITFSPWFEEGTAYWVSAEIRGTATGPTWDAFRDENDATFPSNDSPRSIEEYHQHSDAGFILYAELAKILGSPTVSVHVRSVNEASSGTQVLESIIRHTPPDKQTEVRNLIRTLCVDTDRFGVQIPCRLPAESSLNQAPTHRP